MRVALSAAMATLAVAIVARQVVEEILRDADALDVAHQVAAVVGDLADQALEHLPAALEVEVAPHREDALVAVALHDVDGRAPAKRRFGVLTQR